MYLRSHLPLADVLAKQAFTLGKCTQMSSRYPKTPYTIVFYALSKPDYSVNLEISDYQTLKKWLL